MSTEIRFEDFLPSLRILKWTGKATIGLAKGAMYLGQKSSSKNQDAPHIYDNIPALQSSNPCGVVFGKQGKVYVGKPESMDGHVMVVGGVGSGKTSCIAIPTLKSWNSRVFAIDIKGELHRQTRINRPNVKIFNPLVSYSCGYNPYYFLNRSTNKPQEAKAIAQALIPIPPDIKDTFWLESAQSILAGAILHFHGKGYSFLKTIELIQSTHQNDLIETIYGSAVAEARYYVSSFLGTSEKTLSGIMLEISQKIIPFATDKNLISCLSRKNTITPLDLEYGHDIYIQIPEHLLRQWKGLLTLIVNQFLTYFEQRNERNATPILFMLDEFPRLGKIESTIDGLATLRSKKITICLILQSLAQLDLIYGTNERKVIADTCGYKAILSATDAETQEYFSRLVGTYDDKVTAHGTNTSAFIGFPTGKTSNTYEQEKRIIKPEEFAVLQDIVLLTPFGFTRVEKTPYYIR